MLGRQLFSALDLSPTWRALTSALVEQVIVRGTQTRAGEAARSSAPELPSLPSLLLFLLLFLFSPALLYTPHPPFFFLPHKSAPPTPPLFLKPFSAHPSLHFTPLPLHFHLPPPPFSAGTLTLHTPSCPSRLLLCRISPGSAYGTSIKRVST